MILNINFQQTGGVPLTNDLMAKIMEAIKLYDVLGSLAGHMTIIAGCDPVSGSVNIVHPGVVAINDEVLLFEGGAISTNVFVQEIEESEVFEDQQNKVLTRRKIVKFGNAAPPNQFAWADFVKINTIKDIQIALAGKANQSEVDLIKQDIELLKIKTAPIKNGGVVWFFRKPASEVPAGWKECIDFRRKTIFGYDPTSSGTWSDLNYQGGTSAVTLKKENLPAVKIKTNVLQPYGGNSNNGGFDGGSNQWNWVNRESENLGSSEPIDILNPHRLINFIEPDFQ